MIDIKRTLLVCMCGGIYRIATPQLSICQLCDAQVRFSKSKRIIVQ